MGKSNARLVALRQRKAVLKPEVLDLYLGGLRTPAIAKKLELSERTVRQWLEEMRKGWAEMNMAETGPLIVQTTARYEHIFREAMAAWWRSVEGDSSENDAVDQQSTTAKPARKPQLGSAIFLARAMEALKGIREIRGLDAPRRTEITGPSGGPIELAAITGESLQKMSSEQLDGLGQSIDDHIRGLELEARHQGETAIADQVAAFHALYQAGLSPQLAPPDAGEVVGPGGGGPLPATDGLHAPATRQE